jgi:hypothetical protein
MMSTLLASIQELVGAGKVRVSAHGFEELASDDITLSGLLSSTVHVLWGIAKNAPDMATLITAYRPDPDRWSKDFLRRKSK